MSVCMHYPPEILTSIRIVGRSRKFKSHPLDPLWHASLEPLAPIVEQIPDLRECRLLITLGRWRKKRPRMARLPKIRENRLTTACVGACCFAPEDSLSKCPTVEARKLEYDCPQA